MKKKIEEFEDNVARPEDREVLDLAGEFYRLAVMYGHYLSESESCDDEDDAAEFLEAADAALAELLEELEKAAAWLKEEYDVGMDEDEEEGEDEEEEEEVEEEE